MSSQRRLHVDVLDDGQTVLLSLQRYARIGNTWVELEPAIRVDLMSFPAPDDDQWVRDMLVALLEHA